MTTSAPIRRKQRSWTDDAIRLELERLIGDSGYWPCDREFRNAGLTGLETILRRRGEVDRWMREFDVTLRTEFDESRVERELRSFTEGRTDFPTQQEFEEAGLQHILWAARSHGGPSCWAAKLGLTFEGYGRGTAKRFYDTPGFIAEMKQFCDEAGGMPTEPELFEAGRGDLLTQIRKHGGFPAVAGLIGVDRRGSRYDDDEVEAEIRALVADTGIYPSHGAFLSAGKGNLYALVQRRGGSADWARRLGLEPPRRGRQGHRNQESPAATA